MSSAASKHSTPSDGPESAQSKMQKPSVFGGPLPFLLGSLSPFWKEPPVKYPTAHNNLWLEQHLPAWVLLLNLGQIPILSDPDFSIINGVFLTSMMGLGIEQITNVKIIY